MSDTTDHTPTEPEATDDEPRIPSSRLRQEAEKRRAAEARVTEYEQRLAELEDRDKTDVERLTKQLERAQKDLEERDQRLGHLTAAQERSKRESWIRSQAAKLNFRNPDDAVPFVDLDGIEDERQAERAVKRIAGERDYLLRPDAPEPKGLDRILAGAGNGPTPPAGGEGMTRLREATDDDALKIGNATAAALALQQLGKGPLAGRGDK